MGRQIQRRGLRGGKDRKSCRLFRGFRGSGSERLGSDHPGRVSGGRGGLEAAGRLPPGKGGCLHTRTGPCGAPRPALQGHTR